MLRLLLLLLLLTVSSLSECGRDDNYLVQLSRVCCLKTEEILLFIQTQLRLDFSLFYIKLVRAFSNKETETHLNQSYITLTLPPGARQLHRSRSRSVKQVTSFIGGAHDNSILILDYINGCNTIATPAECNELLKLKSQ